MRLLALCFTLLCAPLLRAATADDALIAQRNEFKLAWEQVAATTATTQDSASLRSYVLYPYLQAARLQQALQAAGTSVPKTLDDQIAAFIRAREGESISAQLRQTWLANLAARSAWANFLAFHKPLTDGVALRCHRYAARIAMGNVADLAPQVAETWLTPRSLPECERAFAWLDAAGGLTPALIEQRARKALEADNADFARQIIARLPEAVAAPLLQWAALLENPQREIDALIASPQKAVEPAALLAGWTAFARANRNGASTGWCAHVIWINAPQVRWRWRLPWRCRGIAMPMRASTSRKWKPPTSTTARASGRPARRCGRTTGSWLRAASRRCPKRAGAPHAGATGPRAWPRTKASQSKRGGCTNPC
jgi:soluble lytic murein transglycosylase